MTDMLSFPGAYFLLPPEGERSSNPHSSDRETEARAVEATEARPHTRRQAPGVQADPAAEK